MAAGGGKLPLAAPLLLLSPARGDGHPVLVLPGFTADDASTVALRWSIRGQGYSTHAWRLGRNIGPTAAIVTGIRSRLAELAERPRAHRQHRRLEPRRHLRAACWHANGPTSCAR